MLALLVACAAACLAWPNATLASPPVGIDDFHPRTFTDSRFKALGIRYARLVVPWNGIFSNTKPIDDWMKAARADGVTPLVAFEHELGAACPAFPCYAPTDDEYAAAFDAFRARYPFVTEYTPWNEANHSTQPTATDPARAAAYYNVIRAHCPDCTVVAADVLDAQNTPAWVSAFRQAAQGDPQLWGLHNYPDVNRTRDSGTAAFLAMVPGQVWLTETGGIVSFVHADGTIGLPYDEQRAADALEYLFHYLLPTYGQRVTRAYVHEWRASPLATFDSGLLRPDGSARPSLRVLQTALGPFEQPLAGAPGADGAGPGGTSPSLPADAALQVPHGRVERLHLVNLTVGRGARATFKCDPGRTRCAATVRLLTAFALSVRRGKHPRAIRVCLAHAPLRLRAGHSGSVLLVLSPRARRVAKRHAVRGRLAVMISMGPLGRGFPRRDVARTSLQL